MAELKTVVKPIACGGAGGDPVAVDSKDDKIVRIRPLHWDMSYSAEELAGSMWELNARSVSAMTPSRQTKSDGSFGRLAVCSWEYAYLQLQCGLVPNLISD